MALDKSVISEIKHNVNIVDVIGEVVSLTKSGRNYLGLCPFHQEKTPSFNVIEDKQFFHCFGCGKSGDVFKFLEEYRQITFMESVKILSERIGMDLAIEPSHQQTKIRQNPHQKLFDINQDASKFYQAVLKTTKIGEAAKQYLYDRGLDDRLIDYFNIGLAPDESNYLYQSLSPRYDEDTILNSGLFNLSEAGSIFDSFRNRIIFPLTDENGHVIGFSGRIWTQADQDRKEAKYKNTRATTLFNKSYELYHLDKAKPVMTKSHEVYLMEGFMDVIAAYRAGIKNAVASMGTALTPEHVSHLKKFTKKVILTYDGDNAGQNAIAKSLAILQDLTVEIVRMPNQMDPDEFIKANSAQELAKLLSQSRISSTEFWIQYLRPENVDNLQAEIAYVERIAKIIAGVTSITAQNTYINMVAESLPDFDYFQVEQSVNNERLKMRAGAGGNQLNEPRTSSGPLLTELPVSKTLTAIQRAENQLFYRLLQYDYLLNEFRNRDDFVFESPQLESLYQILCQKGEISDLDLAQMADDLRQAYYSVQEEELPRELADGEITGLEQRIEKYRQEQDLRKRSKIIRDSSSHGDDERALLEFQALVAQKKNME
ncbi:DNA primase [Streptococcus criceti]|uniref:DNA primase n=1 Tax=Streptococcus criceti HS-6 TaxID=873449 RepID=G5JTR1_STRCG|nr:DNA primase [Streptococcus criceti]EHI73770.1 DNA primase [Streptococcus criceti HS-6]SUN37727.1 DNA primase [Streptococcus criceti]